MNILSIRNPISIGIPYNFALWKSADRIVLKKANRSVRIRLDKEAEFV